MTSKQDKRYDDRDGFSTKEIVEKIWVKVDKVALEVEKNRRALIAAVILGGISNAENVLSVGKAIAGVFP